MLGYEGFAEHTRYNYYHMTDYIMDNVVCTGEESDLGDCDHETTHNCYTNEAAGVECHDFNMTLAGDRPGEGAVLINGRPVCDDGWDDEDAKVVCRQLGYARGSAIEQMNLPSLGLDNNFILNKGGMLRR